MGKQLRVGVVSQRAMLTNNTFWGSRRAGSVNDMAGVICPQCRPMQRFGLLLCIRNMALPSSVETRLEFYSLDAAGRIIAQQHLYECGLGASMNQRACLTVL
jgi:hypothetical protein